MSAYWKNYPELKRIEDQFLIDQTLSDDRKGVNTLKNLKLVTEKAIT